MDEATNANERRTKMRFALRRDMRYKLLINERVIEAGAGETIDISSRGVAFVTDRPLRPGAFVEMSISWPVLLGDSCAMRLWLIGRVVRSEGARSACSIQKYEFRTQGRLAPRVNSFSRDSALLRWFENNRRDHLKSGAASA